MTRIEKLLMTRIEKLLEQGIITPYDIEEYLRVGRLADAEEDQDIIEAVYGTADDGVVYEDVEEADDTSGPVIGEKSLDDNTPMKTT